MFLSLLVPVAVGVCVGWLVVLLYCSWIACCLLCLPEQCVAEKRRRESEVVVVVVVCDADSGSEVCSKESWGKVGLCIPWTLDESDVRLHPPVIANRPSQSSHCVLTVRQRPMTSSKAPPTPTQTLAPVEVRRSRIRRGTVGRSPHPSGIQCTSCRKHTSLSTCSLLGVCWEAAWG